MQQVTQPRMVQSNGSIVRTLQKSKKKDFIKHQFIGCYWNKGILAQKVTHGYKHESPVFRENMRKIPRGEFKEISGDKAFLARVNCKLCADKEIDSCFKIKKMSGHLRRVVKHGKK